MKKNIFTKTKNLPKYILGFIVTFVIRLVPFRPPNIEPIMTTTMPFSKKWGPLSGALFGALSIILYDLINPTPGFSRLGIWTFVTATMYALVGFLSGLYFKKLKQVNIKHYVGFAVIATLAYDFITGPIMSSLVWNMGFLESLIGQIPFTLSHLLGNIVFAALLSPAVYDWIVDNKNLELDKITKLFSTPFN